MYIPIYIYQSKYEGGPPECKNAAKSCNILSNFVVSEYFRLVILWGGTEVPKNKFPRDIDSCTDCFF